MRTKQQIKFTHDAIEYTWDDVPEEKYNNWLLNTKDVLNTKDYTAWGFPFVLQIEPTSLCNLACTLCPTGRHELNRPYRHMRFNEFKSLIDNMERYLLFLILWDWGEPLMNPELPSIIRYASERGIQTVTSTNAHFLNNEAYTEELLKSGLTTLIVAVDSILADKYEIYRKNGDIDRVLGGLANAISVKKRIGSKTLINVRMVIMKQNEHEIEEIENMARISGADLFTVKSLNPSCGLVARDEELLPVNPRYRRYEYIPNTYERARTDAICRRVWTMSNIFSNGDVVPCCYDYDSEMKVGNIFETPFTQIWNNSAYRQLRKRIYHEMQTIAKCNHCGINFKLTEHGWFVKAIDLQSDHGQISFSIIMPAYNRKYCIKNAIDSLLAQTYKKFELIIVDDGSTDGTKEYLTEIYKEEIKKEIIRFIQLPQNKGASFARNEGLSKARYNWIGYLDTDNKMREEFLETFADSIEKNASHEIYYAQIKNSQSQSVIGHEFNFDELIRFNFIDLGVFVHSAKIYDEIGGFDVELNRVIDWDLIIKYTEKYPPKFIEKVLLDYDDNPESSRISNDVSCAESYQKVILNYYKRMSPQKFIEKYTGQFTSLKQTIVDRDKEINSLNIDHEKEINSLNVDHDKEINSLNLQIAEIAASNSWKITAPLRFIATKLKALCPKCKNSLQNNINSLESPWSTLANRKEAKIIRSRKHNYEYDFDPSRNTAPAKVVRMVGHNKRVLEIGAGPGSITKILKKNNGCRITGVEIDSTAIAKLSEFCEAVYQCDLNAPEWTSELSGCGTFDVIVAADVFEHLYNPQETLAALKPFLSPDGYLVISLPHIGNNAIIASILDSDFKYHNFGLLDKTHIRFFGIKNIQQLVENSGYKILAAEFVINPPEKTELASHWEKLPAGIKSALANNRYGSVYQVVMKVVPARDDQSGLNLADIAVPPYDTASIESFKARVSREMRFRVRLFASKFGVKL